MALTNRIVGGSNARSDRSLCHRVAVREIPIVTMTDILRVLESHFQGAKDDKKTSQEDLNFLKIMEEGIEKTGNGHYEMPLPFKDQPLTRRGVLATVASVYDPLGFLAPLVLRAKKILQEICSRGVSWDESLPEEVRPRWERWKRDLLRLNELQIPRCFEPKVR